MKKVPFWSRSEFQIKLKSNLFRQIEEILACMSSNLKNKIDQVCASSKGYPIQFTVNKSLACARL